MEETVKKETLNLDIPLKRLDGEVLKAGYNAAKLVAEKLASRDSKQDFMKYYNISLDLYRKGKTQVDEQEKNFLKDFIKSMEIELFIKGQILELF